MSGNKWKDLVNLYKHSFILISKDRDLLRPMVTMALYKTLGVLLLSFSFYFFIVAKNPAHGFLSFLALMSYGPLCAFLQVRQQAALSWMSFEVLTGKDTDIDAGVARLKGLNGKLFLIAIVNVFLSKDRSSSSNKNKKQQGLKEVLVSIVLAVVQEVWDVVQNFLVPTLTIEKCTLNEGVDKLKSMKKNIPAAIGGTIGLDVIGSVSAFILSAVGFPLLVLGMGAGYFTPDLFPASWMLPAKEGVVFNLLPVCTAIFITLMISSVVSAAVLGLKTIYYSTFYVSLNRPLEIREEMRSEITQYLNFKNQTKGFDFFGALKPKVEDKKLVMSAHPEFNQAQVDKLKKAFESNLTQGHSPDKIGAFLLKKGFKKELIEFSFDEYVKDGVAQVLPFINSKATEGFSQLQVQKFLEEKGFPQCVVKKALKAA